MSHRSSSRSAVSALSSTGIDTLMMDVLTYRRCRSLFPILPPAVTELGVWIYQQSESVLVELLWDIEAAGSIEPSKALDLARLKQVLREGMQLRTDAEKIYIWADAGVEPPDFVWQDPAPDRTFALFVENDAVVSPTVSSRVHERKPTDGGFSAYSKKEREIQREWADYEAHREIRDPSKRGRPLFFENAGAVSLFSIMAAEELYDLTEAESPRDTRDYVHGRIKELLKRGSRRGLASPPLAMMLAATSSAIASNSRLSLAFSRRFLSLPRCSICLMVSVSARNSSTVICLYEVN